MTDENPAPSGTAIAEAERKNCNSEAINPESSDTGSSDEASDLSDEEFFSKKISSREASSHASDAIQSETPSTAVSPDPASPAEHISSGNGDSCSSGTSNSSSGFYISMEEAMEGLEPPKKKVSPFLRSGFLAAAAGIAVSLYFLFGIRGELTYWLLASSNETALKAAEAKNSKILDENSESLVRLSGKPAGSAVRFKKRFVLREIVALDGMPVAVERNATNTAGNGDRRREAPPDMSPVDVRGRLIRDDALPAEYTQAFGMLASRRELIPERGHFYLLRQDEVPRSGFQTPAIGAGLIALLFLNLLFLYRNLSGARQRNGG